MRFRISSGRRSPDQKWAAEEVLRVGEGQFRVIADSIPAQIAVMTPAGEVESVNRQVLEYVGATLEELKGWMLGDTVHPDDFPSVIAAWKRSVATGSNTTSSTAVAALTAAIAGFTYVAFL